MTDVWQAGKTYVPGSLARPTSGPVAVQTSPINGSFEDGLTGWTVSGAAGWSAVSDKVYDGTKAAKYIGSGISALVNNVRAPVSPGQSITAFCVVSLDHIASKISAGRIQIYWFDVTNTFISSTDAAVISKNNSGNWQQSLIAGTAPANAAFASVAISANADASSFVRCDGVGWYYTYGGPPNGLAYKAVQASPGKSGGTEPAWPPTLGTTVVDNEVTWEAVIASQIVYTARPINRSGASEPPWPTTTGGLVHDGTIDWQAITPQVTDVNCPQTKIVAIAASKVYAADNDIIRYCATVNPLDWTSADDAGYLPYGLQTYGSNPVQAMNLYRSNLAAFNSEGMQLWQVDEDPSQTALLDALPVGSTQNQALAPVSNDLIFLSSQGVRSIGVASSSTNLQAGDIGMPIDPLMKEAVSAAPTSPMATYVPSMGQYWIAIADPLAPGPTISGALGDGSSGDVVDFQYTITSSSAYTLTIISGAFPDGLSISPTGHVTGTRGDEGEYVVVFKVTDASGRSVAKTDPSQTFAAAPVYHGNFRITAVAGSNSDSVGITVPRGQWKLAIFDLDIAGLVLSLYVDNVLIGTRPIPLFEMPAEDILVGASGSRLDDPATGGFRGMLWGAGVFNGAMTQDDRDALWNDGAGISFADLAAQYPDTFSMLAYAWQMNDAAGSTSLTDIKSGKSLTVQPASCRSTFIDAKFGQVTVLNATGRLRAMGTASGGPDSADHVAYFAWVFSGALSTDLFPAIISRYSGTSDPYLGLRSFWVSDT